MEHHSALSASGVVDAALSASGVVEEALSDLLSSSSCSLHCKNGPASSPEAVPLPRHRTRPLWSTRNTYLHARTLFAPLQQEPDQKRSTKCHFGLRPADLLLH